MANVVCIFTNIGYLSEGYVSSMTGLDHGLGKTEGTEPSHQLLVDGRAAGTAHLGTHTGQEAQSFTTQLREK